MRKRYAKYCGQLCRIKEERDPYYLIEFLPGQERGLSTVVRQDDPFLNLDIDPPKFGNATTVGDYEEHQKE